MSQNRKPLFWRNCGGFNPLENTSQIGSFPLAGLKIKNVWNPHLKPDWWIFLGNSFGVPSATLRFRTPGIFLWCFLGCRLCADSPVRYCSGWIRKKYPPNLIKPYQTSEFLQSLLRSNCCPWGCPWGCPRCPWCPKWCPTQTGGFLRSWIHKE